MHIVAICRMEGGLKGVSKLAPASGPDHWKSRCAGRGGWRNLEEPLIRFAQNAATELNFRWFCWPETPLNLKTIDATLHVLEESTHCSGSTETCRCSKAYCTKHWQHRCRRSRPSTVRRLIENNATHCNFLGVLCLTCFVYLGQVARMLKERGRLIDAPEDSYDSNFLTRQSLSRVWEACWT